MKMTTVKKMTDDELNDLLIEAKAQIMRIEKALETPEFIRTKEIKPKKGIRIIGKE